MTAVSSSLAPLKIGRIAIDFPVVLASLAGFSDLTYRLICRSCSAPYATTEAMLDRLLLADGKLRRRLIKMDAADHPLAGQIMGQDPAVMAQAAIVLRDMGFDVIDLNFACPVKKVVGKRRGGYLMDHPDLALDILRAVLDAVPDRPVTLKLRRAFRDRDAGAAAFWTIAHGAFEAGVAALCVHARTVEQKYKGPADWSFLARVKREFRDKTILGSGDVYTAGDALKMLEQTGVDGVIAARGAIGNPWIFRQARDLAAGRTPAAPTLEEQRDVISRHFELAVEAYGPRRAAKIMRNFGIHYARQHPHPGKARSAFIALKTEKDWRTVMSEHYGAGRTSPSLTLTSAAGTEAAVSTEREPAVILASASPRRRELLQKIITDFRIVPSGIEEEPLRERNPVRVARRAALAKASAVGAEHPASTIIAADTLVCLGVQIFGKPESADDARLMLQTLSGQRHMVVTAVAVYRKADERLVLGHAASWVTFKALSPDDIERYLETENYLDKAGSYAIQESGSILVERLEGDYENVVGLPLGLLGRLLEEFRAIPPKP
jgi:tRNA-dihydrouridine synthase B